MRPVGRMTCSTKTPPVLLHLPAAGRGRDVHGLRPHGLPLLEAQRAVVHAGGQAEAVFGQRRLAAEVAAIHAADLRNGDVALVGEDERVVGKVFEQRRRRLARPAAGEIARIVLDAGAGAGGLHHLDVEDACAAPAAAPPAGGPCALSSSRRCFSSSLMLLDGLLQRRARRDVVRVGVDLDEFEVGGLRAGERVELVDALHLVAEEVDAPGAVLIVGREDLDHVAAHAEGAAREVAHRCACIAAP